MFHFMFLQRPSIFTVDLKKPNKVLNHRKYTVVFWLSTRISLETTEKTKFHIKDFFHKCVFQFPFL